MSLLRAEKRSFPEPFIPPYPGAVPPYNNLQPSPTQALQVSAVWACVQLLAGTVSMMPVHAYTTRKGVRVPVPDPPLLAAPSADATTPEWLSMLMMSALLRGNTYGLITRRDSDGFPMQIDLVDPDKVRTKLDATQRVAYQFGGIEKPSEDVYHFRGIRMPGMWLGLSPIQYAAMSINREAAIQAFTLGYFNDAPHPQAILTSDQPIDADGAETLKSRIMARIMGREPLVLGAGVKYTPLSISPEESQFLETQRLGVTEIARIYQVRPEKIGGSSGNSMTYATMEDAGIDFLTYSIQRWLTWIEASLSALFPGRYHVRFDPGVLLRTDTKSRLEAAAIGIASKQLTPDEARGWGDLPPLTDEQKQVLELVPMTVGATGIPKIVQTKDEGVQP